MRLALSHTQGAGPHLAVTPPLPGPGRRARPLGPDSGARAGSSLSGCPLAADRSQGSRSGSPRAPQGPSGPPTSRTLWTSSRSGPRGNRAGRTCPGAPSPQMMPKGPPRGQLSATMSRAVSSPSTGVSDPASRSEPRVRTGLHDQGPELSCSSTTMPSPRGQVFNK